MTPVMEIETVYSLDGVRGLQPIDPSSEDNGELNKPDYIDKPDAPSPIMNPADLLKNIISRLIRSARTGKPHGYLPELVTAVGKLGVDAYCLATWIPSQAQLELLVKCQSALGNLVIAEKRETEVRRIAGWFQTLGGAESRSLSALLTLVAGKSADEGAKPSDSSPTIQRPRPSQRKPGRLYKPTFLEPARIRLKGDPQAHLRSVKFADSMATGIVIYLDETWPKHGKHGVVAGVVWLGREPDPKLLPLAPQHLRLQNDYERKAIDYLTRIRDCPHAIPFVFRFEPPAGMRPTDAYEQMVHESILMLLGWVLPERVSANHGKPTGVKVICEAIGADHHGGRKQTDVVRGLMLQAARRDPGRFERWAITEVRWVQKTEANPKAFSSLEVLDQGYLGYADLLAYMTLGEESQKARVLREILRPEEWAECMTISAGLANLMEQVHVTAPAYPGDFLQKMSVNLGNPVIDRTLNQLKERWKDDTDAKTRILAEMDARYTGKVRDLPTLSRQFEVVRRVVGELPSEAPRRLRLIEMALRLQRANHFGDPTTLAGLEHCYADLRRRALENGEADLVAHVDLNLAVSASDRFEPDQALIIIEDLLEEESRLSLLSRAKLHSARGQYFSMTDKYQAARDEFNVALGLINQADLTDDERAADWDQTAIYRAFNAIDASFPEAREMVQEIIRKGGIEPTLKNQFRHHLWLRFLFSDPALADERQAYLDQTSDDVLDQHPWQLIAMYRALFAVELNRMEDASKWFNKSLEVALGSMHGATLRTIAAVIATVAWHETGEDTFKTAALGIMSGGWEDLVPKQPLTETLPTADFVAEALKMALHNEEHLSSTPGILNLLKFNYR